MKRFFVFALGALTALAISGKADAAPMYYTFEGQTVEGYDYAGVIADAGLNVSGSYISYVFLIDVDAPGSLTKYDGSVQTFPEPSNYFYTDLLNTPFENQNGGYAPMQIGPNVAEANLGYFTYNYISLEGGSNTNFSYVRHYSSGLTGLVVGSSGYEGYTHAFDDAGGSSYLFSSLTLTSISDTAPVQNAPVPEPGTLLLLGSGMAGLGVARKLRNRKA